MTGVLSFEALNVQVEAEEVDTALICLVDMEGWLAGKGQRLCRSRREFEFV